MDNSLIKLLHYISDIIVPSTCELCFKTTATDLICADCSNSLGELTIFEDRNCCQICKQKLGNENLCCSLCREAFGSDIWINSVYQYKHTARDLVKTIKYNNRTRIIKKISNKLIEKIYSLNFDIKLGYKPVIVATPSHVDSILSRGFNSTYYLTETIRKKLGLETQQLQIRLSMLDQKNTNASKLRYKDGLRELNIAKPKPNRSLYNRNCIIIDDVITTGSTVLGLAKLLKIRGANKILIVSIARSIYYPKLVKKLAINEILKQ